VRPDDVEDEEAQEDAERDEAEDRADISDELRQGGPSYLSGLLAVEYGNIGRDQRPTVGRALQTELPSSAATRSASPTSPVPAALAPPIPSSRTSMRNLAIRRRVATAISIRREGSRPPRRTQPADGRSIPDRAVFVLHW
jgi:hypothetical protein